MAEIFTIKVVKNEWTPYMKKLKGLPNAIGNAGHEMCRIAQRNLRRNITRLGLIDTRNLWQSTEARKLSKFRSVVFIPQYGLHLDEMTPHYVSLKGQRNIRTWVDNHYPLKQNPHAKGLIKPQRIYKGKRGALHGAIWVRPTPWIDQPMASTMRRANQVLQKHIKPITGG